MGVQESYLESCGCKMLLRRTGAGETMLFLHGAGGVPVWPPFFDQLAERFDLLVPDHPSFGRSETPEWLDEVGDLAYFYLDVLEQLDLRDVHVVGHSLGGWIALEAAVRATDRIKSLTLISSAGIRIKGAPAANIFIMDRSQLINSLYADPKLAEQMLAIEPTPEQIDEIITNSVATARLGWQPRLFNPNLRKWLHRIKVPTHIIWGDQDQIIPPAYAAEFAGLIGGASLSMIENAGHIPQMEQLEPVMAAMTGFFERSA
ncbi:MAG: alpha/beta fold hydrolase [Rhodospirillales bacterium]|nr:alpha/beta fold hydrolase [Rhodospirillales bacterium]